MNTHKHTCEHSTRIHMNTHKHTYEHSTCTQRTEVHGNKDLCEHMHKHTRVYKHKPAQTHMHMNTHASKNQCKVIQLMQQQL